MFLILVFILSLSENLCLTVLLKTIYLLENFASKYNLFL